MYQYPVERIRVVLYADGHTVQEVANALAEASGDDTVGKLGIDIGRMLECGFLGLCKIDYALRYALRRGVYRGVLFVNSITVDGTLERLGVQLDPMRIMIWLKLYSAELKLLRRTGARVFLVSKKHPLSDMRNPYTYAWLLHGGTYTRSLELGARLALEYAR